MTKLAIAALALGLAGAGALAAVGVKRLSCGECPLTGAPIAHHHARQSHVAAHGVQPSANASADVAAEANECPVTHATGNAGHASCPGSHCVPDCAENPPPQCAEKQCAQKQSEPEKKVPAENP